VSFTDAITAQPTAAAAAATTNNLLAISVDVSAGRLKQHGQPGNVWLSTIDRRHQIIMCQTRRIHQPGNE